MKLHKFIILGLATTLAGCQNMGYHTYNKYKAKHQNIQAASLLKMGMSTDEAQRIMGDKPVRLDTESNTTVWQYCDTQRNESNYVALSFSTKSNVLKKINYYTIFWEETKGTYNFDGVVVDATQYQLSCDYVAQKMGVKNPEKIDIWFTNADVMQNRSQQQEQQNGYNGEAAQRGQQEQQMRQIEQHNRVNGR